MNTKIWKRMTLIDLAFLFSIASNFDTVCAQKIRTIEHSTSGSERLTTARDQFLDTLDIQIKVTKLNRPEVVRLSVSQESSLPQDYWVILSNPANDEKRLDKNICIFYNLNSKSDAPAFFNSQNWPLTNSDRQEINPIIDQFGEPVCHIFWVEIFNHRANLVALNPTRIFTVDKIGFQYMVMLKDELSSVIERNIEKVIAASWSSSHDILRESTFLLKKKAILDNLFSPINVFSNSRVEGLLCFPRSENKVIFSKIIIPKIKFYDASQILFQSDIAISINDNLSN